MRAALRGQDAPDTALREALYWEDLTTVKMLVQLGARVNTPAVHQPMDGGRAPVGRTPLMLAAEQGDLPVARLVLNRGANVNAAGSIPWQTLLGPCERRGCTALIFAAEQGHSPIVEALLAAVQTG